MKNFKLIPMLEFVSYIGNRKEHETYEKDLAVIYNYANFLNQPLKLEMFVPCDENGNPFGKYIDLGKGLLNKFEVAKKQVLFTNTSCDFDEGLNRLKLAETYTTFSNFNDKFGDKILEDFAFRKDLILKEEAFNRIFL